MSAPGGLCSGCGGTLQWTTFGGELFVRCAHCIDLFEEAVVGTDLAGEVREGREAEDEECSLPF